MAEAFPEDAESERERVGFALHRALGYRYISRYELTDAIQKAGMTIRSWTTYLTSRPPLHVSGIKQFISDECHFCDLDGSPVPPQHVLWKQFHPLVKEAHGVMLDAKLSVVVAQRTRQ